MASQPPTSSPRWRSKPAVGGTRFDRRTRVLVASPACPAHFGGRRTRNRRSAGHGPGRPCRWRACGCTTASGARTPVRAPWTWLGVTPISAKPRLAPGRMEPDSPIPPPLRGHSQPTVPPGRVSSAASRRWRTRCPTTWPLGCPASRTKTGTRPFRLAVWPSRMVLRSASGFRGRTMTGGLPLGGARNVVRGSGGCSPGQRLTCSVNPSGSSTNRRNQRPRGAPAPEPTGPPTLDDGRALREVSNAQIVQSIESEVSNDGTHETKAPELRRR